MPTVRCPIDGYTYETPDIDPVIEATLITIAIKILTTGSMLNRGGAITSNSDGTDKIIQLLECCDE